MSIICGLLAALLGALAVHLLILKPGFPIGHDTSVHMWGIYGFLRSMASTSGYPLWIHEVGIGLPLPIFYGPLTLLSFVPFWLGGFTTFDVLKFGYVAWSILATLSMYLVSLRLFQSRRAALLAALAYAFAPYRLLDVYTRSALGESAAFVVAPWCLGAALETWRTPGPRPLVKLALSATLLIYTHPLTATTGFTLLGLGLLGALIGAFSSANRPGGVATAMRSALSPIRYVGAAVPLALLAAGAYLVPLLANLSATTVTQTLYFNGMPTYTQQGITPLQLITRALEIQESSGALPTYYFGLTFFLIALLVPLDRNSESGGIRTPLLMGFVFAIALTLKPFDQLAFIFPPLVNVQLPWRFLLWASVCGAMLIAYYVSAACKQLPSASRWRHVIPALIAALILVDFFPFSEASNWHKPYLSFEDERIEGPLVSAIKANGQGLRVAGLKFPPASFETEISNVSSGYPEYWNSAARTYIKRSQDRDTLQRISTDLRIEDGAIEWLNPSPYAELIEFGALPFRRTRGNIVVELNGHGGDFYIKEQYFPGWQAKLNDSPIALRMSGDGLMLLTIPEGSVGELKLFFPFWTTQRSIGVTLALLAIAVMAFYARSR